VLLHFKQNVGKGVLILTEGVVVLTATLANISDEYILVLFPEVYGRGTVALR